MEFSEYSEKDMKDGKELDTLHTPYTSNNTLSPYSHITMIIGVSEIHLPYSPNNNDANCTITPCRERTLWGRAS